MQAAVVLALLLLAPSVSAQKDDDAARDIAKAVDRRYNRLRSLSADFVEIFKGAGMSREEAGTLRLKKPGKMRWDYTQPRQKVFLSDGKTAFFHVTGEAQARRMPLKKLDDLRSPLRFLLGKSRLEKEFEGLAIAPGAALMSPVNTVLRGRPKHLGDRLEEVLLEVTPASQIVRIVATELDGSVTEFRFSNLVEGAVLPDSLFQFSAPAGVEVVEGVAVED